MKRFAVIGNGNFGYYAARALYEKKNEVIAIDRSKERVQAIEPYVTTAIVQDATDAEGIKGLGLDEMDAVIVSTGADIKPSILICFHLAQMGIQYIIVKAEDSDHAKILKQLGATETIQPGMDIAQRLAMRLTKPNILEYLPLEDEFTIMQIEAPPSFEGKSLKELDLRNRYDINVVGVKEMTPEKFVMIPHGDFVIKSNDTLVIIGKEKHIYKIKELK
ncbi:MAG: TrkA family potassium uptake protein [Desulfosalsimonadaceae bacterium]